MRQFTLAESQKTTDKSMTNQANSSKNSSMMNLSHLNAQNISLKDQQIPTEPTADFRNVNQSSKNGWEEFQSNPKTQETGTQ